MIRDTQDGTPSSVVEKYLLGEKSTRTGQVAGDRRKLRMYRSDWTGTEGNSRGNPRALNSQWRWQILTNSTLEGRELCRCSLGLLPLFSRRKRARYKRGKRDGNLNKSTFLVVGSS